MVLVRDFRAQITRSVFHWFVSFAIRVLTTMAAHFNRKSRDRENSVKILGSQYDLFKKVSKQKSSSKFKESLLAETFERFRTQRMAVRMMEGASYRLKPLSTLHFREELGGVSCLRWSPEGDAVAIGLYSGDLKVQLCTNCNGFPKAV